MIGLKHFERKFLIRRTLFKNHVNKDTRFVLVIIHVKSKYTCKPGIIVNISVYVGLGQVNIGDHWHLYEMIYDNIWR